MEKEAMNRYSLFGWIIFLLALVITILFIFILPALDELSDIAPEDSRVRALWFQALLWGGAIVVIIVLLLVIGRRFSSNARAKHLRSQYVDLQERR